MCELKAQAGGLCMRDFISSVCCCVLESNKGAVGIEAVAKQTKSLVFLSGAGGLGIEIAKNIVLSGCKEFVIQDDKVTTKMDLSSQFYLTESDIGKNRAEASMNRLQQLS